MSNRGLLVLLVVLVLVIGGYMLFEGGDNDVEIEVPELDIDN
jgi:hypothetical protein